MSHRPSRHARRVLTVLLLAPLLAVPSSGTAQAEGGCYLDDPAFAAVMGLDLGGPSGLHAVGPSLPDGRLGGVSIDDLLPCPSLADLTNPENLPDAPMVCTDYENGCDRRYVDPFDPTFSWWDDGIPPGTDVAENTNSFPRDATRGNFTAVGLTVKNHDGSAMAEDGIVGYGLALPVQAARYQPCAKRADPYNGACLNPGRGGYLAAKNFYAGGGSNFGAGLFVGNYSAKSTCPSPCKHWWGQRTGRIDVELYAVAGGHTDVQYVRPRFAQFTNEFTIHANGGTYATPVGDVRMLRVGDIGVVRLAGFVSRAGVRVGTSDAQLRMFEVGSGASSSTGHGLQTFATPGTNANGYYDTGALYAGTYTIKAYDTRTGVCRMRSSTNLSVTGRIDLDLSNRNDFGHGFDEPC
jgi:hypothetical protein